MKSRFLVLILITAITLLLGLCLLNACGGGGSQSVSNPPPPLEITSGALPAGVTGASYAGATGFPLAASGGIAPYRWNWAAAANSSLPPGLTVTQATISGTPAASGSYYVIVTVADSESPPAQKSTPYEVNIDMPLEITSDSLPGGTVGIGYGPASLGTFSCVWSPVLGWHWACTPCGSSAGSCPTTPCGTRYTGKPCLMTEMVFNGFTVMAAGGMSPYTWSASAMPPGLTFDASSGNIAGTPTTAGSYSVSVTVADSESPPAQVSVTYSMDVSGSSSQ